MAQQRVRKARRRAPVASVPPAAERPDHEPVRHLRVPPLPPLVVRLPLRRLLERAVAHRAQEVPVGLRRRVRRCRAARYRAVKSDVQPLEQPRAQVRRAAQRQEQGPHADPVGGEVHRARRRAPFAQERIRGHQPEDRFPLLRVEQLVHVHRSRHLHVVRVLLRAHGQLHLKRAAEQHQQRVRGADEEAAAPDVRRVGARALRAVPRARVDGGVRWVQVRVAEQRSGGRLGPQPRALERVFPKSRGGTPVVFPRDSSRARREGPSGPILGEEVGWSVPHNLRHTLRRPYVLRESSTVHGRPESQSGPKLIGSRGSKLKPV